MNRTFLRFPVRSVLKGKRKNELTFSYRQYRKKFNSGRIKLG